MTHSVFEGYLFLKVMMFDAVINSRSNCQNV